MKSFVASCSSSIVECECPKQAPELRGRHSVDQMQCTCRCGRTCKQILICSTFRTLQATSKGTSITFVKLQAPHFGRASCLRCHDVYSASIPTVVWLQTSFLGNTGFPDADFGSSSERKIDYQLQGRKSRFNRIPNIELRCSCDFLHPGYDRDQRQCVRSLQYQIIVSVMFLII